MESAFGVFYTPWIANMDPAIILYDYLFVQAGEDSFKEKIITNSFNMMSFLDQDK